ncbi:hypothetical protein ThvES_00019400 [Thiovulum sp. ES]|nr:hypothetical protein ThvES_00019400 [Thiovulum sp. ES]
MSLKEFLENITLEELEELRKKRVEMEGEIPSFSFSRIKFRDLKNLVNLKRVREKNIFSSWFESEISLSNKDIEFLENLIEQNLGLLKYYDEEDLKIHFLSHIFHRVNFKSLEKEYRDFYNENIRYENEKFILNGEVDFVVAKGLYESEIPYFFIQEFKKEKTNSDPEPQLVSELIAGLEISNVENIRGAFIVGSIWNFVILEKVEKDSYRYFVSENFDSSKIEDLKSIYKNLLFVKNEIDK